MVRVRVRVRVMMKVGFRLGSVTSLRAVYMGNIPDFCKFIINFKVYKVLIKRSHEPGSSHFVVSCFN